MQYLYNIGNPRPEGDTIMSTLSSIAAGFILMTTLTAQVQAESAACPPALDVEKRFLAEDRTVNLCDAYRGNVVLVVNTASKCAFTPQYDGLEALYRKHREDGLMVLGFPSNDFRQEYTDETRIQEFCRLTYSVEFPMFEATSVRKGTTDPLYSQLAALSGEYPRWNFHKYLIGRDGRLVASFPSQVAPDDPRLVEAIEALLNESS
jgi:glutathione peroxidase